jgi:hypothetical protein
MVILRSIASNILKQAENPSPANGCSLQNGFHFFKRQMEENSSIDKDQRGASDEFREQRAESRGKSEKFGDSW